MDLNVTPKLDDREQITVDMYDKTARKWAGTSDGVDIHGNYLWQEGMDALPKWAAIAPVDADGRQSLLEIGFGTGRDAVRLAPNYFYTGVDPSKGFLEVALEKTKEILSRNAFGVMSVYELNRYFSPRSFDLFWCCATLLHCTRDRMPEALANIRHILKHRGVGFISLKEGDGEADRTAWSSAEIHAPRSSPRFQASRRSPNTP